MGGVELKRRGLSTGQLAVLYLALLGTVGALVVALLVRLCESESEREARAMIRESEPFYAALDAYVAEHGQAPQNLGGLVPDFIVELPRQRSDGDPFFEYSVGDDPATWALHVWGGEYQYTRTSAEPKWFVTGDRDMTYSLDRWLPLSAKPRRFVGRL